MLYPVLALAAGLALLVWGAHRFVAAAAALARLFKVPPLLIGMIIVGFGTSAPEMLISAMSSYNGNPGIALGNAFGSNIVNIALILGCCACIHPLNVSGAVIRRELPLLGGVTLLAALLLWDGDVSRLDAGVLLAAFGVVMAVSIRAALREQAAGALGEPAETASLPKREESPAKAWIWLVAGLGLMLASSRAMVWGAVEVATALGVGDLVIGLTIVAVGTSLPELASSVIAARKGEHDLAIGNILGSNTFNTLAVVGIAGIISPMRADPEIMTRDIPVMALLTALLYVFCRGWRGPARITRFEGVLFLAIYAAYTGYLIYGNL